MKYSLFLLFIFFHIIPSVFAQGNPFLNSNDTSTYKTNNKPVIQQDQSNHKGLKNIAIFNSFIKKNAQLQKRIKGHLVRLSNEYKTKKKNSTIFIIFLLAFLYGVLHSLGPGHGKVFVFSYILTEKPKVLRAIATSYAIAFVHGFSGLIIALIIVFSLKTYSSEAVKIGEMSNHISRISYLIILVMGVFILLRNIRSHAHKETHFEKGKFIPFVLSVGLVPCPGTIIVVTFLASVGLLSIGILSSLFIILGMGITISLIGILSLFSTEIIKRLYSKNSINHEKLHSRLSIIGALFLILLGGLFFIGTL